MKNVTLEQLIADPHLIHQVQIDARRERARAIGALFAGWRDALRGALGRLRAARPAATQRTAHC